MAPPPPSSLAHGTLSQIGSDSCLHSTQEKRRGSQITVRHVVPLSHFCQGSRFHHRAPDPAPPLLHAPRRDPRHPGTRHGNSGSQGNCDWREPHAIPASPHSHTHTRIHTHADTHSNMRTCMEATWQLRLSPPPHKFFLIGLMLRFPCPSSPLVPRAGGCPSDWQFHRSELREVPPSSGQSMPSPRVSPGPQVCQKQRWLRCPRAPPVA